MTKMKEPAKTRFLQAGRFALFGLVIAGTGAVSPAAANMQVETVLYNFAGGTSDGAQPYAGLFCCDSSGNLYGATFYGGTTGQGTVYSITPTGTETVVYNLPGIAGGFYGGGPSGTPVLFNGNIFGTATYDFLTGTSSSGDGVVYELTPNGSGGYSYSVLHHFAGDSDGANPFAGVTVDKTSGNLYGTTRGGLDAGDGSVYKLTPQSTGGFSYYLLHVFAGGNSDGEFPYAGVTLDPVTGTTLYGTTALGATLDEGIVFMQPATVGMSLSIMHQFGSNGSTGGWSSMGGVLPDSSGNIFYGTTELGGASGYGVIYQLLTLGGGRYDYTHLHDFTGSGTDGAYPYSSLTPDSSGNLYGTTTDGGTYGQGVVFELVRGTGGSYTYSTLHSFAGGPNDGANPYAGVTFDPNDGNLYGTTFNGGMSGYGVVFKIVLQPQPPQAPGRIVKSRPVPHPALKNQTR